MRLADSTLAGIARFAVRVSPKRVRSELARSLFTADANALLDGIGPALNRDARLESTPFDLEPDSTLEFEDLGGFFASNSLNHGLIGMTIRQAAYLFGVTRRSGAKTAIEIGRWRGGSTITIAAALGPGGRVWSIDLGEKEARLFGSPGFDDQTREMCARFGLDVELIVGDSRTLEIDTGDVDLVFIDGDHSYEGARSDFDRFGRRARIGGSVLLDDAFPESHFHTHADSVGRVVREAVESGDFRLVKSVDRLAHLERVA